MNIRKYTNGYSIYYRDEYGYYHREDGPAIISIDLIEYCIDNRLCRLDGPARIWLEQPLKLEYFVKSHGSIIRITESEFYMKVAK